MRLPLFLMLALLVLSTHAQERVFYSGLLPEMAISSPLSESFEITLKVQSMHGAYLQSTSVESRWQHIYERTDFQFFVTYRVKPLWKLSLGYQSRIEGKGGFTHRAIQQLAAVQRMRGYRLGHRFRADQTYRFDDSPEYRMRYRLSAEMALQGLTVDPGEWYLKLSEELLFAFQDSKSGLENRIVAMLGYNFNRSIKLETGLDYRIDRFLDNDLRQRLWLSIGLYINLGQR